MGDIIPGLTIVPLQFPFLHSGNILHCGVDAAEVVSSPVKSGQVTWARPTRRLHFLCHSDWFKGQQTPSHQKLHPLALASNSVPRLGRAGGASD